MFASAQLRAQWLTYHMAVSDSVLKKEWAPTQFNLEKPSPIHRKTKNLFSGKVHRPISNIRVAQNEFPLNIF